VPNIDAAAAEADDVTPGEQPVDAPSPDPTAYLSPASERTIMGEKRRVKSKGKTAKATKHGLRPHELREQQDAVKQVPGQPATPVKPR
jgi:hypothetical protein